MNFTDEQRRIGKLIGIQVLDSQNDLNQINRAQEGAKLAGINVLDSANDLRQIEEYYAANQPAPTQETSPTSTDPVEVEPTGGNSYYEQLLADLQISNQNQASNFQNQMQQMQQQQQAAQEQFRRQALEQQQRFETAQRTTLSNQARGAQQTDTRLGGTSKVKGGTAGFIRRPKRINKFSNALAFGPMMLATPLGAKGYDRMGGAPIRQMIN